MGARYGPPLPPCSGMTRRGAPRKSHAWTGTTVDEATGELRQRCAHCPAVVVYDTRAGRVLRYETADAAEGNP